MDMDGDRKRVLGRQVKRYTWDQKNYAVTEKRSDTVADRKMGNSHRLRWKNHRNFLGKI